MSWCSGNPKREYPLHKDEWKQSGLDAQADYPSGYEPVPDHPVLFCRASDRRALRARLEKEPWRGWYEKIHRPQAEVALAARDLEQLRGPGFPLEVFPLEGKTLLPVQVSADWKSCLANLAFVAFLEDDDACREKAKRLLLEAAEAVWNIGGWGGEDYDVGSGWDSAWRSNTLLVTAYDLVAAAFGDEERRVFEARLARDLEWAQTDPVSPRYNPSWFGCAFIAMTALLLGRDDYVRKIEAMLDQYVDQVLWGEGEYFEGAGYQSGCMEQPNHLAAYAIRHVTGRNPFDNPRWAMRARHWIHRAAPLGTNPTHSDANLVCPTGHEMMASLSLLDSDTAGQVVWLWERIGDPAWFNLRGNDEERRAGVSAPFLDASRYQPTPERTRRYPEPCHGHPASWIMVPDPLPAAVEPPPGSYVARNAGLACLRTDWSMDAMFACLFAPRFYGSPHTRWDALTFDFWAHGAYLVRNPGYHELTRQVPRLSKPIAEFFGVEMVDPDDVIPVPDYCTTWHGWDERKSYRLAPEASNVVTIDGGGGNCMHSRCDPLHYLVHTKRVQVARANGGFNYTQYHRFGTEGTVIRTLIQVEPAPDVPGYWVVVDDVLPEENPDAECAWHLHPSGEMADEAVLKWTTYDFLNFPPEPVHLEVVLPQNDIAFDLKPQPTHIGGGSFQVGRYLTARWKGARRFWAVLRPQANGEELPPIRVLPDDLGFAVGERDLVLVRPVGEKQLRHAGIDTDAGVVALRDGGTDFWLAVAGTYLSTDAGIGYRASAPLLVTGCGERGAAFVDRPHKQKEPMAPVHLEVQSGGGRKAVELTEPGQHAWQGEG